MRRNAVKVKADIFTKVPHGFKSVSKGLCRKAIQETARVIHEELGLHERLNGLVVEHAVGGAVLVNGLSVELTLTDDAAIRVLNRDYREVDSPTDVLSFPTWEGEQLLVVNPALPLHLGEIIVSLDTAARQAKEDGVSMHHMIAWLLAHAMLHLVGFDHPNEEARQIMRNYEAKILRTLGFAYLPKMAQEQYIGEA